ncbi:lysozyme inhibitor LprI family protein [Dyella sp.]|uniref:lysozyme inhibitor LprI family protein n=1 Tax=Dyella sp. TaxID=1869338 RepID=UPI002B4853BC|nr:lysozyme inhibitor LprI family protein [Dyella sp.]HKT30615.1 lysozyme inhibitor LprI family protein [Dyella sp.]
MRTATNIIAGKKKAFLWRVASAMACVIVPVDGYSQQQASSGFGKGADDATGIRPSYQKCLDASSGITVDANNCWVDEYDYQDKRLNTAYKALMAVLSKDKRAKLQADERIWIAYRDSHCVADPGLGQSGAVISQECKLTETAKQAAALEYRKYDEDMKR